jgi:Uma2 family endonuclease
MTLRTLEPPSLSQSLPVFYPKIRQREQRVEPQENLTHIDDLVTEDDEPVDNTFSEKQQRLLTHSLYNAWTGPGEGRSFLTMANVGLFYALNHPPLVPDVLVSLDVKVHDELWSKLHRSYFVREYGKPPEVVIEIVSNLKGKEADSKLQNYAKAGVRYYVIFDPEQQLKQGLLCVYELQNASYVEKADFWLPDLELGLTLWKGYYEDGYEMWLRWCDQKGKLIATGTETTLEERLAKEKAQKQAEKAQKQAEKAQKQAEKAQKQTEKAQKQAEQERLEKEQAQKQAKRLAAQLRALGIEPQ